MSTGEWGRDCDDARWLRCLSLELDMAKLTWIKKELEINKSMYYHFYFELVIQFASIVKAHYCLIVILFTTLMIAATDSLGLTTHLFGKF